MRPVRRLVIVPIGALCIGLGVAACGETTSTGNYTGEKQQVAQTITNLQSDATGANAEKVCSRDLASSIVNQLQSKGVTCKKALEGQLREIDTFSMTVESITLSGDSATALVKSTWSGKQKIHTLSFVKEGSSWKVSKLS